jgi:hypothetical protein
MGTATSICDRSRQIVATDQRFATPSGSGNSRTANPVSPMIVQTVGNCVASPRRARHRIRRAATRLAG